jgi:hypothetical protein
VQSGVVERRERVVERRLQRAVDLDDMEVLDARREVLGEDAQAPAHLEHDVVRRQLGGATDHLEQVVVDQEVLAELAVRADAELAQAPQAGLPQAGRLVANRGAHQPKTRAALASTVASSSS